MSCVAIITARGGSKGLPGKNLRQVGGLSLVARAIRAAQESGVFDQVVVTTDDPAISAEAQAHGAEVIQRPAELAGDRARSIDAVLHALDTLAARGRQHEIAVLLQPTSPLRTAADVRQAVALFRARPQGCVIGACPCEHHPYKTLLQRDGELQALLDLSDLEAPRQSLPPAFRPNGAIYVNRVADLQRAKAFLIPPIQLLEMDARHSLDVDSAADLTMAELLLAQENLNEPQL